MQSLNDLYSFVFQNDSPTFLINQFDLYLKLQLMKLHSASAKSSLPHAQLDWGTSCSIIVLNQTKVQSLVRAPPFTHTSSDQLYAILLFCISAVGPHALQGSTLSLYTVASQVWCSEAKLLGHAGSSLVASATNGRTPVFLGVGTYDDRMAHSRSTTFWCLPTRMLFGCSVFVQGGDKFQPNINR